jgi:phosphoglucosamine mutase
MARLFGTDGVRGVVGKDLTSDLAFDLGRAAVVALGRHGDSKPVFVIGRDTRESGSMLAQAMAEGIGAGGGDALLAGVQTTPAIAYLTTELRAAAGVVLSASHNPPEYNGIKFFSGDGYKLPDDIEDEIESLLGHDAPPHDEGHIAELSDGSDRYIEHIVALAETRLDGLRVVVDCANGAASHESPEVLRRLGAEVRAINNTPDGSNINEGCGALHPDVVAAEVVNLQADAGVAHDGDADRALFADADGNVVDGDQVLAACAVALRDAGRLVNDTVVSTVMANLGFRKAMAEARIEVIAAKVGDRYVLEEMRNTGAVLGGEQSGHIIFGEHSTTGDGILTAVQFLSLATAGGRSIADLASVMHHYPQVLVNVEVADREALDDARDVWASVRTAESELGDHGRVLLRASGTEPLVRVMVEAETEEDAISWANAVADQVKRSLG